MKMCPTKWAWRTTARRARADTRRHHGAPEAGVSPAIRAGSRRPHHRRRRQRIGAHRQAVMILGGTVDYFIDTVFNYPTLAECYKAAAFNGLGRLHRYQ